jgi:ribosomal peptide maturation radical SAM protein 1
VIDYVFLGEADLTLPLLVEGIIGARSTPLPAGVVGRSALATEAPLGGCDGLPSPDVSEFMVQDMDELPYPDYDDYFQRLRRSPLGDEIEPLLFFETSRGCWWGQRRHCKFCGLNGSTLTFRSKGPQRAIDELRFLAERYGVRRACASDNILDPAYFDTLLPMLAEAGLDLSFACEMKTNLKRQQAEILVKAGLGAAQLGIETFITPVLKMVGKGACAMDNLQALKWFSESGIKVEWNLLYGFPNEKPSDYAALAELLPSLYHLAPPQAVGRVRLDRFSPYFEDPEAQGMTNARPNRAFRYTYPFSDDVLARLAYYYEYDYADGRSPLSYAAPVLEAVKTWQQLAGTVTFRYWDRPDGVLILTDTRPQASAFQYRLTGLEREVYLLCDSGRRLGEIAAFAGGSSHQPAPSEPALREMLDVWVGQRITAHLDGRYLSLALRAPGDRG